MIYQVFVAVALLTSLLSLPATAAEGLIQKASAHSTDQTVQRFKGILEKKGIRVFAHVNHQKNAQAVNLELNNVQVIIFGNPLLGTPLMQANPTIGIDLPMKVLIWEDAKGEVWLAYNDPSYLVGRHGIDNRQAIVEKMGKALKNMTNAATSP